jgi:DNA replication and repair protein RecF
LTFAQAVAETEARDRLTGSTLAGPHRADLDIRLETVSVKGEASRGEQKLVAATLVLAQAYVYAEAHPGHCVLLVDDPAAELDANAVERLLCALARIDAQLVLTGLSPSQLAPLMGFPVFHVEQGRVQPVL